MTDPSFTPSIYLKHGCPFCLKVRVFLLEAGLLNTVNLIQGATPEAHRQISDQLARSLEKVSFPAAEIAPGKYLQDSEAIVARFANTAGVDTQQLPTFQEYAGVILPSLQALHIEIEELNKELGGRAP